MCEAVQQLMSLLLKLLQGRYHRSSVILNNFISLLFFCHYLLYIYNYYDSIGINGYLNYSNYLNGYEMLSIPHTFGSLNFPLQVHIYIIKPHNRWWGFIFHRHGIYSRENNGSNTIWVHIGCRTTIL